MRSIGAFRRLVPSVVLVVLVLPLLPACSEGPASSRDSSLRQGSADGSGALDPSFGDEGKVTSSAGGSAGGSRAYGVAIQPDGKIVAVGTDFQVVRYNTDGSLDTSFGESGEVAGTFANASGALAVAIQPDGKIVVVGTGGGNGSFPLSSPGKRFALARYDTDGALDTSFGSGGTVTAELGQGKAAANGVAIQSDGRIVAAGFGGKALVVARFGVDGSLDASFGGDGIVKERLLRQQRSGSFGSVAIQPDGRIVAAGTACDEKSCSVAVARYRRNGSLHRSFGENGTVTTSLLRGPETRGAVALQPSGKMVVAVGRTLLRFRRNGSLEPRFGGDGTVRAALRAEAVGLQDEGRIVLGGTRNPPPYRFVATRYGRGGNVDPTFGKRGSTTATFPGFNNVAYALAVQPDDKVVLAGTTSDTNLDAEFALARFLGS